MYLCMHRQFQLVNQQNCVFEKDNASANSSMSNANVLMRSAAKFTIVMINESIKSTT